MTAGAVSDRLSRLVAERESALLTFLEAEQDRLARACHDMARAFAQGGVLVPFGTGAAATDAAHVAVEFMHPVIVGKRALPALVGAGGRAGDIALVLAHRPADVAAREFLSSATARGMLTIAFGADAMDADHAFVVPSGDPAIVQEVQETAYHVLWELVHVFFDHPGLLEDTCITCGDVAVEADVVAVAGATATVQRGEAREEVAIDLLEDVRVGERLLCHAGVALEKLEGDAASFLYPFMGAVESDLDAVLTDVRASTVRKGADATALRRSIDLGEIARCGAAIRAALEAGGRLLAFGNGGSATDAMDVAADVRALGLPAAALVDDVATITAVGNDVGFDNVFSRQLIPLARSGDVALAISTSGSSANIVAGLEEAHARGMLTCAITGYDGGRLAQLGWLDHLIVVRGDYVPRLQEAQATVYHLLLERLR
ncbi:MAG: SIS domain-containing protein [Deltaproteobacteria bacterium]|nr:SIS domain-containing protein [Deltaproteobacteria bacterium]